MMALLALRSLGVVHEQGQGTDNEQRQGLIPISGWGSRGEFRSVLAGRHWDWSGLRVSRRLGPELASRTGVARQLDVTTPSSTPFPGQALCLSVGELPLSI